MSYLDDEVLSFLNKTKEAYIPYLVDKFGTSKDEVVKSVCNIWSRLDNPHIYNNSIVVSKEIRPRIYEVCDGQKNRGGYVDKDKLDSYIESHNKEDQHMSVFMHDYDWIKNFKDTGSVSCSHAKLAIEWIPLELDRESIEKSVEDAITIYVKFPYKDRIRFFFSGNRSIHIMIHSSVFGFITGDESIAGIGKLVHNLAIKIAGDCRYNNDYTNSDFDDINLIYKHYFDTFKKLPNRDKKEQHNIRQSLQNIDPNLFHVNSLIRLPNSIHHKTGKQKTHIDITSLLFKDYKNKPQFPVKEQTPFLIGLVDECYIPQNKLKRKASVKNKNLIDSVFYEIFEEYEPDSANPLGWLGNLYSPFYDDNKPSVCVNVLSGYYKDFGDNQTYNLYELYAKYNEITIEESRNILNEREKTFTVRN